MQPFFSFVHFKLFRVYVITRNESTFFPLHLMQFRWNIWAVVHVPHLLLLLLFFNFIFRWFGLCAILYTCWYAASCLDPSKNQMVPKVTKTSLCVSAMQNFWKIHLKLVVRGACVPVSLVSGKKTFLRSVAIACVKAGFTNITAVKCSNLTNFTCSTHTHKKFASISSKCYYICSIHVCAPSSIFAVNRKWIPINPVQCKMRFFLINKTIRMLYADLKTMATACAE